MWEDIFTLVKALYLYKPKVCSTGKKSNSYTGKLHSFIAY